MLERPCLSARQPCHVEQLTAAVLAYCKECEVQQVAMIERWCKPHEQEECKRQEREDRQEKQRKSKFMMDMLGQLVGEYPFGQPPAD